MKHLGLDIGEKTIGVAHSDSEGTIAFPLIEIATKESKKTLEKILEEKGIEKVVVGESRHIDGTKNSVMETIEKIVTILKEKVEVVFHPEDFSTKEATRLGKGSDAEAATILLQSYLDREKERKAL